jgi:hypothetical protein
MGFLDLFKNEREHAIHARSIEAGALPGMLKRTSPHPGLRRMASKNLGERSCRPQQMS